MPVTVTALIKRIPFLRGKKIAVATLEGGLTNRNYRLECGSDRFVLRIAGETSPMLGIDRGTEHSCAQAAFAAGIAPEVVAFLPEHGAMVTRFVQGLLLDTEAVQTPSILRRVVNSLHRYHECPNGAGQFSAFDTVRRYYGQARKREVPFPKEIVPAMETLAGIEHAVGVPDRLRPCHNDLLPANFIYDKSRVWILDWEYAGVGDLFFDLGNLAANNCFGDAQEQRLLEYYFGKTRPADLRRLRLMRLASDMREAMWGFLQMGISTLAFDYRGYAHRHLRRFLESTHKMGVSSTPKSNGRHSHSRLQHWRRNVAQ
jgi:thiamine kinase-like enzyme